MKTIKIIVGEDANTASSLIISTLTELGYEVLKAAYSGDKILAAIEKERPHAIILDFHLKGPLDGIETARTIKESYNMPIIFLTENTDNETVERALKLNPAAYLLKPINPAELDIAIKLAIANHDKMIQTVQEKEIFQNMIDTSNQKDFIFVRADYRLNKINLEDVYFIEALKDYVVINTAENIYTTHATMKEILKFLPHKDFVRIHRSFITRFDKIYTVKYPDLVIEGIMKVLPIGGLYRKELFRRLNAL